MVSVRVKRLRKRAALGSCRVCGMSRVNLSEMCDNMWYLGSFGDEVNNLRMIGASSARSVMTCQLDELTSIKDAPTSTRITASVHTGAYNHDIVDDCETAFTTHPLPSSVPHAAVHKSGSFVHPQPSLVECACIWQLFRREEVPG